VFDDDPRRSARPSKTVSFDVVAHKHEDPRGDHFVQKTGRWHRGEFSPDQLMAHAIVRHAEQVLRR
jgi:hypothetical protein